MSSQVDQVKAAIDIVEVIGERIKLHRSGKNFRGLCPFHSEKSPSFFVSTDLARYKCFGCQESGDVYTFLQKYEQMTFAESLEYLAKRAGITLEDTYATNDDRHRTRLLALLSLAKEYYHYLLTSHALGEPARLYLAKRGTTQDTIKLFGIGYSLDGWDNIAKYLINKKGYTQAELVDCGLSITSDGGRTYDRFRGRIMFPLTNHRGQVVGFSGRVLNPEEKQAKYINTPETTLYHKSELLFGFSQLHRFISQKEEALIVEGEFDVLSSFQANVSNVVAIKGSALSVDQLKLLARHAKRIVFALDADKAGVEATKRAIALAKDIDVSLRVLALTGGKDPDEIARHNPGKWRTMVAGSVSVYDYLIDHAFSSHDPETGEGKREISKEVIPLLSGISNAIEQAHYVQHFAKRLGVSEETVVKELRKVKLPTIEKAPVESPVKKQYPRQEMLLRYLIALVSHMDGREAKRAFAQIQSDLQPDGVYGKIVAKACAMESWSIHGLIESLPEELSGVFSEIFLQFQEDIETIDISLEYQKTLDTLLSIVTKKKVLDSQLSALQNTP